MFVVIGTSEITKFDYQHDPRSSSRPNSIFIQNIVDYMNGNYGIPEMRSKGLEINPIREDNALAMSIKRIFRLPQADAVNWAKVVLKILNILLIPAVVISLTGFFVHTNRKKRKDRISSEFDRGGSNEIEKK